MTAPDCHESSKNLSSNAVCEHGFAVCSCSGTLYSLVETKKNSTRATLNKRRDIRSSETTHSEVPLPLKLALKNMHLVSNDVYSFIFY